jgi:Winged helix DNA-binding domain
VPAGAHARLADLPLLTRQAQNRALLARQLLLERDGARSVADALAHLVGLQAQSPKDPYFGLWSRLEGFDPDALGRLLTERRAVRMTLMRATVHLVAADDAVALRPLLQPMIERAFTGTWGRRIAGVDLDAVTAAAEDVLASAGEPLTGRELAARVIADHGIAGGAEAIRHAINVRLALVQVPPRGVWGKSGRPRYAALESWLVTNGRAAALDLDTVVLRYLRAFGPAGAGDVQKWSGLTRCASVLDRLRPQLLTFRSESGRELFDLPDAPRPDPATPAPVRFLPEFDNLLLSHADREHVIPDGATPWLDAIGAGRHVGNVLVDGMLRATWWLERPDRRTAELVVRPLGRLTRSERTDLLAEAERLAAFAGAGPVRFA